MRLELLYRKATRSDTARLFELRRKSILELAPTGMSVAQSVSWAMQMTVEGMGKRIRETNVWVAEINDVIVGWVAIRGDYLDGLYTDPKFAKQGIGTGLLSLAEARMRNAGEEVIRLEASWNSEDFYLQRGYEPAGPRPPDGARPLVKRFSKPAAPEFIRKPIAPPD